MNLTHSEVVAALIEHAVSYAEEHDVPERDTISTLRSIADELDESKLSLKRTGAEAYGDLFHAERPLPRTDR